MTIRYEANPPKIFPGINSDESITRFIDRIKMISPKCDAIHLTENVLGHTRVSPLQIGKIIHKEIPDLPITVSMRVRDKSQKEVENYIQNAISSGISGVLVLMGDPAQTEETNSGLIPSQVVKTLVEKRLDEKIDLYLSISNNPNFLKIKKKIDARPNGFMTQVIQTTEQVQNLVNNLKEFRVIPIVLFPSEKNQASAKFLNLNMENYKENFNQFLSKIHSISGDVLITSPNDFVGLNQFLEKKIF